MAIQLTTPISPVAPDTEPSTVLKVDMIMINLLERLIEIRVAYGRIVEGDWVETVRVPQGTFMVFSERDYPERPDPRGGTTPASTSFSDLMSALVEEGESVYDAASRVLYQWMLDKGYVAGTII